MNIKNINKARVFFKENPQGTIRVIGETLVPITQNKEQFQNWLIKRIHSRINREDSRVGRRHSQVYYYAALRMQRMIKQNNVIRVTDFCGCNDLILRLNQRIF